MPQRIFCAGCNATFYDGLELESPTKIIERYGNCPKCGKKLNFEVEKVKVNPWEGDPSGYSKEKTTVRIVLTDKHAKTIPTDNTQKTWYKNEESKS